MADYTTAWIAVIGTAVGAVSGMVGQIILARSQTGREERSAVRSHNLAKRAELKVTYRRVLDAADSALAAVRQKAFYQGNESEEERDKRHLKEIQESAATFRKVMNDIVMESGSREVVAAIHAFWSDLQDFMLRYEIWLDARRYSQAGVPLPNDTSNERLWDKLPEVVTAHGVLQERIRDHLDRLSSRGASAY